jgi:threonine dehydrogenase-like Zn-dependent dehydrogenase
VVIQGCGPQGLAATVIAREVGARRIIVTGLARDASRLDLARRLGATDVVVADREDVAGRVAELTGGRMADVCLDVSGSALATPFRSGRRTLGIGARRADRQGRDRADADGSHRLEQIRIQGCA